MLKKERKSLGYGHVNYSSGSTHDVPPLPSTHPCSSQSSPSKWTIARYVCVVPSVKETVHHMYISKPSSLAVNPSPTSSGASMTCVSIYQYFSSFTSTSSLLIQKSSFPHPSS